MRMKEGAYPHWWLPVVASLVPWVAQAEDSEQPGPEDPMTNARLERIIQEADAGMTGQDGRWQITLDGVPLIILTNETHNRMRIVAPVAKVEDIDEQTLTKMMEANFTTALDARYAIYKEVVWTTFIHPLDTLQERDLVSALQQVATLVRTTGTTYSSSELRFGPSYEEERDQME